MLRRLVAEEEAGLAPPACSSRFKGEIRPDCPSSGVSSVALRMFAAATDEALFAVSEEAMTAVDTFERVRTGRPHVSGHPGDSGNPLREKLAHFAGFDPTCWPELQRLFNKTRKAPRRRAIIVDGKTFGEVALLLRGWAFRAKIAAGGERQILSFLLPGDLFPIHPLPAGTVDYEVIALTPCDIAVASVEAFDRLLLHNAEVGRAFWWLSILDKNILRAWLVNIGTRDSYSRIAHLFCEIAARLRMAGQANGPSFDFPVTQQEIADSQGMTPVHVNRMLQQLRANALIKLDQQRLTIRDPDRLCEIADFDPEYLIPGGRSPVHLVG